MLDMGEPIKILQLAQQMIALSGFKENVDIDIEFSGLKAGEKLYEEVQHFDEVHRETEHSENFKFISHNQAEVT